MTPAHAPPLDRPLHRAIVARLRSGFPAIVLFAVFVAGCAGWGTSRLDAQKAALERPLASLADSGDVEAMRVIADIEVLRAQGMLSDSLANSLTALPGREFMAFDEKGVRARVGRGLDIGVLLEYASAEPVLLKELAITPEQAAELRRLVLDNMAAAAEMATSFQGRKGEAPN